MRPKLYRERSAIEDNCDRIGPTTMEGGGLILERTENPQWLSNSYLLADRPGGSGVLVDGNDTMEALFERVEAEGVTVTHVLLTHPHGDHVAGIAEARERLGGPRLVAHPAAAEEVADDVDETLEDGSRMTTGGLEVEAIETPGHAAGHLAYLVNGVELFTGDVLFKGTVGGTKAPGASGFEDLKSSVMRLMELAPETRVHPGHREPTTIGDELEANPFVRVWRGLDDVGAENCTVWGQEATLKLWAPDYDGGNKAWVLFRESGEEAIVGGSQVERDA
jgi:glyoxylase-like metal-dependent hydrolase (beta-lactamase superfamily II)